MTPRCNNVVNNNNNAERNRRELWGRNDAEVAEHKTVKGIQIQLKTNGECAAASCINRSFYRSNRINNLGSKNEARCWNAVPFRWKFISDSARAHINICSISSSLSALLQREEAGVERCTLL